MVRTMVAASTPYRCANSRDDKKYVSSEFWRMSLIKRLRLELRLPSALAKRSSSGVLWKLRLAKPFLGGSFPMCPFEVARITFSRDLDLASISSFGASGGCVGLRGA